MIVTFEVSTDRLIEDASSLGWDLQDLQNRGTVKIISTTPVGVPAGSAAGGQPAPVGGAGHRGATHLHRWPRGHGDQWRQRARPWGPVRSSGC